MISPRLMHRAAAVAVLLAAFTVSLTTARVLAASANSDRTATGASPADTLAADAERPLRGPHGRTDRAPQLPADTMSGGTRRATWAGIPFVADEDWRAAAAHESGAHARARATPPVVTFPLYSDAARTEVCFVMQLGQQQWREIEYSSGSTYAYPPFNANTATYTILNSTFYRSACPTFNNKTGKWVAHITISADLNLTSPVANWTCDGWSFVDTCPFSADSKLLFYYYALEFSFEGVPESAGDPSTPVAWWQTSFIYREVAYGYSSTGGASSIRTSGPLDDNKGLGELGATHGYGMLCEGTLRFNYYPATFEPGERDLVADLTYVAVQPFNVNPNTTAVLPAPGFSLDGCTFQPPTPAPPATTAAPDAPSSSANTILIISTGAGGGVALILLVVVVVLLVKRARSRSGRHQAEEHVPIMARGSGGEYGSARV